ncbi:MAG: hypothetical protein ACI80K_004185, partial [Paracoccaceae bacterium]
VILAGPAPDARIPELPGQEAFTVADGFSVLIDNMRVFVAGNDGLGGEAGGANGITLNLVNGAVFETYFIRNQTMVTIDSTSVATFADPANPVNGSFIDLQVGATLQFLLEEPDEFRNEHLSKVSVQGMPASEGVNLLIEPLGSQGSTITVIPPPVGANYCTANVNTSGSTAEMGASGSASVATNQMTLECASMPNFVFGFFIVSRTAGFVMNPGGSAGNLCVSGSVGRFVGPGNILNSGNNGAISLPVDLGALPQPNGPVAAGAGETWRFQCWFRDNDMGTPTSNFSDGLAVVFI